MIIWKLIRQFRWPLLASVCLSFASAGNTLLLLSRINRLVTGIGRFDERLVASSAALLGSLFVLNMGSQYLLARFGSDLVTQTRAELARRLLDLEYQELLNRKALVFGSLTADVARIVPLVMLLPQLTYNFLLVGVFAFYLFHICPPLFGVLGGFLLLTLAVSAGIGRPMRSHFEAARRAEEGVFECFRAIGEGKREMSLSATRRGHFATRVFAPCLDQAGGILRRAQVLGGVHTAWSMTVLYGAVFTIAYIGHSRLGLPENTVAQFVVATLFLINPIAFVTQGVQQIAPGLASLAHLNSIGAEMDADIAARSPKRNGDSVGQGGWGRIRAVELSYKYPGNARSSYECGPINLEIRRGELLFLTGGNGSGKSTLLLLLCGLLRPTAGRILIDGLPVSDDLGCYRGRFGGTFADVFLFKHVLDGNGDVLDDERIGAELESLELAASVSSTQGALSTLNLSSGQRRRLALLQCWAEDREIVFFDEWAADQDVRFREYFYSVVLPGLRSRGKTVIVISHDDRYFHVADRVLEMREGRIVQETSERAWEPRAAVPG